MIPAREMWEMYEKGKLTENKTVIESIYAFQHNRAFMEASDEDDLSDAEINKIYAEISYQARLKSFNSTPIF